MLESKGAFRANGGGENLNIDWALSNFMRISTNLKMSFLIFLILTIAYLLKFVMPPCMTFYFFNFGLLGVFMLFVTF